MKPSPVLGFLCLANDRYWPVADTQIHEIMVVREAASDPMVLPMFGGHLS
jgi:hypothetical protein